MSTIIEQETPKEEGSKAVSIPQQRPGVDFMTIIEAAVNNPGFDPNKLMVLIDANERILKRNAEISFNNDMARLRTVLPTVVKNKKNGQTNSKYADLEAVKDAVDPLLSQYGFFDRYEDDYPSPDMIGTTCFIVHRDGHAMKNRVQIPLDDKGIKGTANKTLPHAVASSMTYAQRLSFCRALGIRIGEDDDGNAAAMRGLTDQQIETIKKIYEEVKPDETKFLAFCGADKIENIKSKDFDRIVTMLNAKKKEQAAAKAAAAAKTETPAQQPEQK